MLFVISAPEIVQTGIIFVRLTERSLDTKHDIWSIVTVNTRS